MSRPRETPKIDGNPVGALPQILVINLMFLLSTAGVIAWIITTPGNAKVGGVLGLFLLLPFTVRFGYVLWRHPDWRSRLPYKSRPSS